MENLNKVVGKPLTPPKAFFKWCESQIPTYQWSNKEKTILASERKDCQLIKKRLTKNSRLTYPTKFYPFAIILVTKNRIEIQSYDYWREIKDGKETLTCRMVNFERFSNGQHLKASTWQGNWHEGLQSNYGYMSGAYTNTVFYPNNWNERLKINQDMKYLNLPTLERQEIARVYKYRQEIEYLQNIKATTLANQVLFTRNEYFNGSYFSEVDMKVINKKWLKKHKAILKNSSITFNDIMLDETLRKRNAKRVKGIEEILHYKQIKKIPKEISLNKFQTYILEQEQSFKYYMDYLNLLKELNISLNDINVMLPKDLTQAHDNAVDTLNMIKAEEQAKQQAIQDKQLAKEQAEKEKAYQERMTKLLKVEKEIDDFIFLVPKDLQEIVQEGNALHHCVGMNFYLTEHAKGKTNIIFIRKKEDKETPYFTMEYKHQQVEQIQGKYNREEVPSNVQQAVNKWQKEIKNCI